VFVSSLVKERHARATLGMEAQYLVPWDGPFEQLSGKIERRLLKPEILSAVDARVFDLNYLVDTRVGGVFYQFNIGPLHDHEIPGRVAAQNLREVPAVALFVSIATRKPYKYEFIDLASYVRQTITIGNTLIGELGT
jgi:hypothetical protein